MKNSITLTRKEAEDLISLMDQRIVDKEVLGFPSTEDEQETIRLLQDKLAGRIE